MPATHEFREPLPSSCPPSSALVPSGLLVYRLVKSSPPTAADFASHAELGIAPLGVDECRARSCSVFSSPEPLDRMRLLPKFRSHSVVVRLDLDELSGVVNRGHKGHYDWWVFRSFDPCQHSTVVREY